MKVPMTVSQGWPELFWQRATYCLGRTKWCGYINYEAWLKGHEPVVVLRPLSLSGYKSRKAQVVGERQKFMLKVLQMANAAGMRVVPVDFKYEPNKAVNEYLEQQRKTA